MQVTIAEAEAKFEEIIDAVLRGEDVVITRNGEALVRVVAIMPQSPTARDETSKGEDL